MVYRLKFGVLLTVIWGATHLKQQVICETLFRPFNANYSVDSTCASRSKGCLRNLPGEIEEGTSKIKADLIRNELEKNLSSSILYPKGLIEYLLEWLRKDDSITSDMKIGFQESPTKGEYLRKTVFDVNEVLADFLVFTVIRNENQDNDVHEVISELKKIDISETIKNYQSKSRFRIIDKVKDNISNLPITIESGSFDDVFTEVAVGNINLPNPNNIHAYILNTNVYMFDYNDLTELVMDNIYNYVYSRQEIRSDEKDNVAIRKSVLRASRKLRSQSNEDQLGQILIYIFLEKVLGAPKLMSKVEMGNNYINGDGVFLNSVGPDKYQIVIGSSKLYDDALVAIDKIMDQIFSITKNGDLNTSNLLLDISFQSRFSTNELQNLRGILVPRKGHRLRTNAFGVFIGYSLNIDETRLNYLNEEDAVKYMEGCVHRDLDQVINRLNEKIYEANLQKYSFYVYMMPFTDVMVDSNRIMYEVIGGTK